MDEAVAVSTSHVTAIQARCSGIENLVRGTEVSQHSALSLAREDSSARHAESQSVWASERAALDRRMLVLERTAEDMVDRLKLSSGAVEAFFATSPEGRRLQAAITRVEMLQVELATLKGDVREGASAVTWLEASVARKHDMSELRDRVALVEPLADNCLRLESQMRFVSEKGVEVAGSISSLEQLLVGQGASARVLETRVSATEQALATLQGNLSSVSELANLQLMRESQFETQLRSSYYFYILFIKIYINIYY